MSYDAIILGSGTNELTAACYLAKARLRVLVLEPRSAVGGTAAFDDVGASGFRIETCGQSGGWLSPKIVRDLSLVSHGLEVELADPTVFSPLSSGESLLLWQDLEKSKEAIKKFSAADAEKWEPFCKRMAHLAGFLEMLYQTEAPRLMSPATGDMMTLMGLGLKLRRLGKVDMIELLRTLPMSLTDLLDDWFETDVLKATVAAGGLANLFQGPRSQGTCFSMLHHVVGRPIGAFRSRSVVKSEKGHLASVLGAAAKALGVEVRTGTPAEIVVKDGRATGVRLANGATGETGEIEAKYVISGADPRRTFLELMDPVHLEPEFVRAARNVKCRGIRAFVNLALGELPKFTGAPADGSHLRGVISISPTLDYLEHAYDDAKHGSVSKQLFLEATIPSLTDPSLAPPGKHVMSIAAQYVPYKTKDGADGGWDAASKDKLADQVIATLAAYAPNMKSAVIARQVWTPRDLEETHGLTEGNLYQGELTLDQILFMRPLPGFAHYRTPIEGLFMCGDATHPGAGLPGLSGANAAREIAKGGT
jgi:phytoene dehydrogenase-like protein